jgi:hypothetical protein
VFSSCARGKTLFAFMENEGNGLQPTSHAFLLKKSIRDYGRLEEMENT